MCARRVARGDDLRVHNGFLSTEIFRGRVFSGKQAEGVVLATVGYRMGAVLAARSSFPLQLQLESMVDIWHQKLSSGLKGGGASFLTATGSREIRLAFTAGGLLRAGGVMWGIGDGL